ncbi:MAG TPA: radical SAM family heme chaperone HemW [Syntrophomonadaceae bacterium]|nr:radical SAM family heme chaperone HemW [Syntrophomonadaceae bacterium]HPU49199.1 radical SAM family heme chaperone HemW [Syntrophomonadaceae bacterium]
MINQQDYRGIYIHIPFCKAKCNYCDFYSVPLADGDWLEKYTRGLAAEIQQRASSYDGQPIRTVYFGGGTPSLLTPAQIETILAKLDQAFGLHSPMEITMEANPATVDQKYLRDCRRAGINRLSLGVQSFIDRELHLLGRLHSARDSEEAVQAAFAAGFDNVNLDLIYGIPGQTTGDWEYNLHRAMALAPQHLSLYLLQLEPHTPLGRKVEAGQLYMLEDEEEYQLYRTSQELLAQKNYRQYEISNFALPGKECHHNLLYWDSREYIGLGAGAVSFINRVRFRNTARLEQYLQAAGDYPLNFWQGEILEEMDEEQRWVDAVILGLRTARGINLKDFYRRFGVDLHQKYAEVIQEMKTGGFMIIRDGYLRLTPSAYFISNQILARFIQ